MSLIRRVEQNEKQNMCRFIEPNLFKPKLRYRTL